MAHQAVTLLLLLFWKHHLLFLEGFLLLCFWPPTKWMLLLCLIYLYFVVVACVSVCRHTCLPVRVCVNVCVWIRHNCVCMCIHPKGYFNFFRILNKQQQLQRIAAASGFWVGWVMVAGGEGWRGEGVCGCGSGGVKQLMVRAPTGHTGASRWRTSEPPHSSTKMLPTLDHC